jgi:hypothetical protein
MIQRDPHNRRKTIVNRQIFSADLSHYTCFFAFCSSPRRVLVAVRRLPSLSCGAIVDQTWRRQRVMSPSGHPAPSASVNSYTSSSLAFINTLCAEKKEKSSQCEGPSSCCYETRNLYCSTSRESCTLFPAARRSISQGGFMCYGAELRAGRPRRRSSSPARVKNVLFSMSSRPARRSIQPPTQFLPGVKRQRREADSSPPVSAEVKENVDLYIHSSIRLHGVMFN